MTVFVRADASTDIGTGHVMRCLALAGELRRASLRVEFVCRETEGTLRPLIESHGFRVHGIGAEGQEGGPCPDLTRAPTQAEERRRDAEATANVLLCSDERPAWLVVDHYALDADWEARQRPHVDGIFVIDDLADRRHDCDVLLDQNYPLAGDAYADLVPEGCCVLQGPGYALLREEFRQARATLRPREGDLRHLMVFFGGVDRTNETAKALRALDCPGLEDLTADVVVGGTNPHVEELLELVAARPRVTLHMQASNMAELTARADLALCAGGSAAWERCCLGLPSAVTATAEHQVRFAAALARDGYAFYLGTAEEVDHEDIAAAIAAARADRSLLAGMSLSGMALVDGLGCQRVVRRLLAGTTGGEP